MLSITRNEVLQSIMRHNRKSMPQTLSKDTLDRNSVRSLRRRFKVKQSSDNLWQENNYKTLHNSIGDIKIETKPIDEKINRIRLSKGLVQFKYSENSTNKKHQNFQPTESKSNIDLSQIMTFTNN